MSLKTFRIEFDNEKATYVAGEAVGGKILLNNTEEIVITGLYLSVEGRCQVFGAKSEQRSNYPMVNSESHLNEKFDIIGPGESVAQLRISVGNHEYPFNFTLPTCIPHSVELKYGYVRYTAKAVLNIHWESDHETTCTFNVISRLDLNAFRERCPPIDEEIIDNLYNCCFLRKTPLAVRIRLPFSGYVPGQSIYITIDYKNDSKDTDIQKIAAKLIREHTFYVSFLGSRKVNDTSTIKSTVLMGPLPKCGQSILQVLVPDLPPSNLQYCKIIDLDYVLVVTIHLSGSHFKVRKRYPVLIGTIPLYFSQQNMITLPMPHPDSVTIPPDRLIPSASTPSDDQLSTSDTLPLNGQWSKDGLSETKYQLPDDHCTRKSRDIGLVLAPVSPPVVSPPVTWPQSNEVPDLQIEWIVYPILAFIYVVVPLMAIMRVGLLLLAFIRMILS